MSKSKDEDKELQIELTKLQVNHEYNITLTTVLLSVFISMMLTTFAVYIPLGQVTNNLLYPLVATAFNLVLIIPIYKLTKRAATAEARLDKDIKELKDRFLSKQAEEKKQSVMSSDRSQKSH